MVYCRIHEIYNVRAQRHERERERERNEITLSLVRAAAKAEERSVCTIKKKHVPGKKRERTLRCVVICGTCASSSVVTHHATATTT